MKQGSVHQEKEKKHTVEENGGNHNRFLDHIWTKALLDYGNLEFLHTPIHVHKPKIKSLQQIKLVFGSSSQATVTMTSLCSRNFQAKSFAGQRVKTSP
jgi:hypothetical protein